MRLRLGALIGLAAVAAIGVATWSLHAHTLDHWLAVHTGTVNEPGPYYAFWSGFGSDLAEFGLIGAVATGVYQLVKKYNCHHPGCWRVGNHPAAEGSSTSATAITPDYGGRKPTAEVITRLHEDFLARQVVLHDRLLEIHRRIIGEPIRHDEAGPEPGAPSGEGGNERRDASAP